MTHEAVRAYYAQFGEREWERLVSPTDGAVEYAVHRRLLAVHLPPSGRVLDLGVALAATLSGSRNAATPSRWQTSPQTC